MFLCYPELEERERYVYTQVFSGCVLFDFNWSIEKKVNIADPGPISLKCLSNNIEGVCIRETFIDVLMGVNRMILKEFD